MKVLITGALGYIGNEIIKRLISKKIDIYAVDRDHVSAERFLPLWIGYNNFNYIHTDICNLKLFDVDLIIHLASRVGYIECDKYPDDAIQTNVEGTKVIASFNKPTLHFSTASVYGNLTEICTELSPCNPQTLYAKTKLKSEDIIKSIKNYCIVRPATAYGLSYKTRNDLLIHTLARLATHKKRIDLFQPDAMRTFYHVGKIADFASYWVDNPYLYDKQIINLGHQNCTVTKLTIINKIANYCDFDLEVVPGTDPDARDYNVDYSKFNNLYENNYDDLDLHIENIVKYYKAFE